MWPGLCPMGCSCLQSHTSFQHLHVPWGMKMLRLQQGSLLLVHLRFSPLLCPDTPGRWSVPGPKANPGLCLVENKEWSNAHVRLSAHNPTAEEPRGTLNSPQETANTTSMFSLFILLLSSPLQEPRGDVPCPGPLPPCHYSEIISWVLSQPSHWSCDWLRANGKEWILSPRHIHGLGILTDKALIRFELATSPFYPPEPEGQMSSYCFLVGKQQVQEHWIIFSNLQNRGQESRGLEQVYVNELTPWSGRQTGRGTAGSLTFWSKSPSPPTALPKPRSNSVSSPFFHLTPHQTDLSNLRVKYAEALQGLSSAAGQQRCWWNNFI